MSETPIFDALVAGPAQKLAQNAVAEPKTIPEAVTELEVLADFADGTRRGALVPLADFMRHRMARALRQGASLLADTQRVESGTLPGLAAIVDERIRQVDDLAHAQQDDIGRSDELIHAAQAHIFCALYGPDGSHDRYGPTAPSEWPWSEAAWHPHEDPRRSLATAAALLAAAIDSLQHPLEGRTRAQRRDEHLARRVDRRTI